MSNETIIEIPLKWLKTLDRDSYFVMFQEFRAEMDVSMRQTFYRMEEIRESMHLPPKYTSYESFKTEFYTWVRQKTQSKDSLPSVCHIPPILH